MTRSGRSLRRRTPVVLVACCLAAAPGVPAAAQSGPAPDPGQSDPGALSPDPAPGSGSSTPASGSSSPTTVQPAPPPPSPTARVQPTATPTETATQTHRKQPQKETVVRVAAPPEWTSKEVTRQAVPSIGRIDDSSSAMLMLGGLALLALVICDTVFLTLSTRSIRRTG